MEKAKRFGLRIPNRLNGQVLVRFFKIRTFEESNPVKMRTYPKKKIEVRLKD